MSNARNLANLLSPGASTLASAAIADDAITAAKVDSTTTAFTVADLVVTNGIKAGTDIVGNHISRILLDSSASGTDVGENFLLDASASGTDVGDNILFEEATDDVSTFFKDGNIQGIIQSSGGSHYSAAAVSISSASFTGTGHFQSITPTSVNSKILVLCAVPFYKNVSSHQGNMNIFRGNASIAAGGALTANHIGIVNTDYGLGSLYSQAHDHMGTCSCMLFDEPNTTDEVFYNICINVQSAGGTVIYGDYDNTTTFTLLEIL